MATRDEKRAHFRRAMAGDMDKSADQLIAEAAARASGQAAPVQAEPEAVQAEDATSTEQPTAAPAQAEPQAAAAAPMTADQALIGLCYHFGARYKNPDQAVQAIKEKADDYEARLDQRRAEAKALGDAHAIQATRIAELETALESLKATHETEIRHLIDTHAAELAKALSTPA